MTSNLKRLSRLKNPLCFLLIVLVLSACTQRKFYRRKEFLKKTFFAEPLVEGPLTIFIHGTKTSLISRLVHQSDYPQGLICAANSQTNSILTRIGYTLCKTDPLDFPLDRFYIYTWPGKLNFDCRLHAAECLYGVLRNHKGPLTIITHSHGCNVALNLAYWAQHYQDTSFTVDRLIVLAPPVQEVTKPYVHSPIFKQVYTFYSSADIMQVGDPQALYWESYAYTKPCTNIPLLSKRLFDPAPSIIQTRILLDWQSPGHLNFLLTRFIKKIPVLLRLVKAAADNNGYAAARNCFIVNIPLFDLPPHLVEPCLLNRRYTPRSTYHKTKRMLKESSPIANETGGIQENKKIGHGMKKGRLDWRKKLQQCKNDTQCMCKSKTYDEILLNSAHGGPCQVT